jgi:hypothetical protein
VDGLHSTSIGMWLHVTGLTYGHAKPLLTAMEGEETKKLVDRTLGCIAVKKGGSTFVAQQAGESMGELHS